MISKLSSHLGPGSILLSGSFAPSLILHLDAGNPLSYQPTGFTVSGGTPTHILDKQVGINWNDYGSNPGLGEYYLQGGYFQDSATPSAGWYIVDDNGVARQVLNNSVWFSSGNPTPIQNGSGWFMVLDGPWTISNSASNITFYETQPTVTPTYDGVNTWYDLTNLNNDISLSDTSFNSTYSQLTNFEGSLLFNGTGSFGSLISGTAIPLMDSHYTIESWFQANSYETGENGGIVGWGNYGSIAEVNALRQSGLGFTNYWWGSDLMATQATASTNHWYHIATTYDGATRKIYLNGELLNSDTPGLSHSVPSFSNLKIGVTADYLDEYFNGRIAGIKIWNKNLNSTQILNSFNISKYRFGYDYGSMTFNDTQSAYLLSSSNDYAFGTNDFTIEAFFKSTATSSHSFGGVISLRDNGSYNTNGVAINLSNANTAEPNIEFGAGGNFITYTASNNQWYHVAISRTGGTSSFFVNGDLFNQVTDTNNYGNTDLTIGRYYTNHNDHYLNGVVSNVRVLKGTSLYNTGFSVPTTPLSGTYSDTKLLITSQEIEPTKDLTNLHGVTSFNIGWTSSLPSLYEFKYDDFSSTDGLSLVNTIGVIGNFIKLTDTSNSYSGNVYRTEAVRFNRNFSFEWTFECSGGDGADGFCIQWTTTNNTNGGVGGDVGMILDSSTINAFRFQTWSNNYVNWYHSNISQSTQNLLFSIRQNVYYWMDYNYNTSTMYIYYSTTNTKPGSAQHTFTGVTFDGTNYYIGVGAATGGSNDNHILKSMKLTF